MRETILTNDEIDIDDLYNNLRVYEDELKRSSGSNSASQNLAFLSSENTGSTNEFCTGQWRILGELDLRSGGYVDCQRKKFIQRQIDVTTVTEKDACLLGMYIWKESKKNDLMVTNGKEQCDPTNESLSQGTVTDSVVSKVPKINRDFSVIIEDWTSDDKEEVSGVQKVRPETRDDKTNYANTEKPKSVTESVVSNPKINRDSVIIEDWTSDDKEEVSGVQKVRPETRDDKSGQNSHIYKELRF
ncbi:hypothetical protein Tco_0070987 [Tanacetum coccineum]